MGELDWRIQALARIQILLSTGSQTDRSQFFQTNARSIHWFIRSEERRVAKARHVYGFRGSICGKKQLTMQQSRSMHDWDAFANFMNSIYAAKEGLGLRSHQDAFFRGHSNSGYTLLPSLFRQPCTGEEDYFWRLERRTFFQFRSLARELYTSDRLDWDVLFHMQHHGVPTRLLDWSSVFGVALYFALLNCTENSTIVPCVWLLNPYALNNAEWATYNLFSPHYLVRDEENNRSYDYGEVLNEAHRGDQSQSEHKNWERLPWSKPLAIYHDQRSDRMFAQSGWFTIHGNNTDPLEVIFPCRPDILAKVDIPAAAIPAAQDFLILAGIGHRQLFPGLDGLAKSIKERFDLNRPSADPNPKIKMD